MIPALLVLVTIDGPDAELASQEIDLKLEDLRSRPGDPLQFSWQIETVTVEGKPTKTCPWYG